MSVPNISGYLGLIQILLVEFGKYFFLILLVVLAYRLARNTFKAPKNLRLNGFLLAGGLALLTLGLGYVSIRSSLGKLYFHYGEQAFNAGRLEQACELFDRSGKYWSSADATGRCGVCLLLMEIPKSGEELLVKAAAMRGGVNTGWEQYHRGLYYLIRHQNKKAVEFLSAVSGDPNYHWIVLKYFAALDLDAGDLPHAAGLMKPYLQMDVTDGDQAYLVASLKLAEGKPAEARALLDKFSAATLTPFWRSRFEKLQAQLKTP